MAARLHTCARLLQPAQRLLLQALPQPSLLGAKHRHRASAVTHQASPGHDFLLLLLKLKAGWNHSAALLSQLHRRQTGGLCETRSSGATLVTQDDPISKGKRKMMTGFIISFPAKFRSELMHPQKKERKTQTTLKQIAFI